MIEITTSNSISVKAFVLIVVNPSWVVVHGYFERIGQCNQHEIPNLLIY